MHPELLSSLAAEHRRDLAAARSAGTVFSGGTVSYGRTVSSGRTVSADRATQPSPRLTLPRYRVSWSRANLAAVAGNRRARSVVIVIPNGSRMRSCKNSKYFFPLTFSTMNPSRL